MAKPRQKKTIDLETYSALDAYAICLHEWYSSLRRAGFSADNAYFLILEKEQYRYQKVISDISGNDIKSHRNEPELLIKAVRDWFKPTIADIPFYKAIWLAYIEFESDFENTLRSSGYNPKDINELTFCDIIEYMTIWSESFQAKL